MELLVEDMWRRAWFEWDQTGWSDGAKHKRGVFGSYSLFFYADKLEHIQKKKKEKKNADREQVLKANVAWRKDFHRVLICITSKAGVQDKTCFFCIKRICSVLTPSKASLTSPGAPWALREKKKDKLPSSPLFLSRFNSSPHSKHGGLGTQCCSLSARTCLLRSFRKKTKNKSGESPAAGAGGGGGGGCLVRWRQSDGGGILPRCVKCCGDGERGAALTHSVTPGDFLSAGLGSQHSPSAAPCRSPPT